MTREEKLMSMTSKALMEMARELGLKVQRDKRKHDDLVTLILSQDAQVSEEQVSEDVQEAEDVQEQVSEDVQEAEDVQETEEAGDSKEQDSKEKASKKEKVKVDIKAIADKVAEKVGGTSFEVRPGGYGVKVGKFRAFALYNNRAGKVRLKSAKIDRVDELLQEYDTSIRETYTADGRDVLLDFDFSEEDTVQAFCEDLASTTFTRKKAVRKDSKAQDVQEQEAEEQEED